ncbi:DNA-directed RNA polymerase subunit alpha C-terminal domain-containing protein [Fusibacter tunisiensis]|uniref:Uncharacterized protein n=1 Tax=Fusibacter tunisiensis TaxID=1008308 RepID=A0ABS2MTH1_9FIRM|nr:DNA-directed RNA polymerase subunit alpha C-terminal domain-containing protein [Fusibacter tunisiensis]MBM7562716.1 hypothetical protein [Fusibacter tunisiensis]
MKLNIDIMDPIERLGLSVRSYNALKNHGIITVNQLLSYPPDQFVHIRNMGAKSVNEILEIIKELSDINTIETNQQGFQKKDLKTYLGTGGCEYIDELIDKVELSVRAKNCLRRAGIEYFSQLKEMLSEEIINLRNIGIQTLTEIEIFRDQHLSPSVENVKINEDQPNKKTDLSLLYSYIKSEIANPLRISPHVLHRILQSMSHELTSFTINHNCHELSDHLELITILTENEDFLSACSSFVLNLISENIYGLEEHELMRRLPSILNHDEIIDQILDYLLDNNKIDILCDNRFFVEYESFETGIPNILKEKEAHIIFQRIQGKTLEEIGNELGVTRERIRQIGLKGINRLNNSNIRFKEDIYMDIFARYRVDKQDFDTSLNDPKIYSYLLIRYGNLSKDVENLKSLDQIIEDKLIPSIIRKAFEKAAHRNHIKIGDHYVPRVRSDLIKHIIKTHAQNEISFEEFSNIYYDFLKDIDLYENTKFHFSERGYMNTLYNCNWVLWKYKKRFRYYNLDNFDYSELIETLNFNQYQDVEISTLKFFRMYPDLMKSYDIRDEYELHNLLKKLSESGKIENITFNRMPNIVFGKPSRENQVYELVTALAPISNTEFAKAYEMEYGTIAETVLANYMDPFEKYFHNGIYRFDFEILPIEIENEFKKMLTKELYFLSEIRELFKMKFPSVDISLLNSYSIKNMGFKVYSGYALREKYDSVVDYFNGLLTIRDIVDINEIPSKERGLVSFSSYLYSMKSDYELIEFLPSKFINYRKLEEQGITKQIFAEYCNDVYNFVGEGKYFTLHYLRNLGFAHKLDELGFDDWFYTSVLIEDKNRISYLRVGGDKLMIYSTDNFKLSHFLEYLMYSQEILCIDFYDLIDTIKIEYNLSLNSNRMIEVIKDSSLFFDAISEKIYIDYETYFEEV